MTDYTKAEAELDAAHEAGEKRFAKLKAETMSDPDEMVNVLSVIAQDQFTLVAGLVGKLAGVTHGYNGLRPLDKHYVREEIAEIAAELGELTEEAMENYIEHY